jgi:uncharacterized membrane protein
MKYIAHLLALLFGCHHTNLSRVFTINKHTYRVCCDCGGEFDYSLATMSIQSRDQGWRLGSNRVHAVQET